MSTTDLAPQTSDPRDDMLMCQLPYVMYIGDTKQGEIRVKLPSLHDYGTLRKNEPIICLDLRDLQWFLHPDRRANFKIVILYKRYPYYRYHQLQSNGRLVTKALEFAIQSGAEVDEKNLPPELTEKPEEAEKRLDAARNEAEQERRNQRLREVYIPAPTKFADMAVTQLKALAKSVGIANLSKFNKEQLVQQLSEYYKTDHIGGPKP